VPTSSAPRATEITVGKVAEHVSATLSLPHTALSRRLDAFVRWIGERAAWLWAALVIVILTNVTLRYAFGRGYIFFEEIQWHVYGIGFILGLSYCLQVDRHVRIDVLSEHWPIRVRTWIEFLGLMLLLLPFVSFVLIYSVPFIMTSWRLNEVSAAPGGLPYRWVAKSFIFIGFSLLFVAAVSRLSRVTSLLFRIPKPLSD
jgi:TRAP-type mannitol/chloroaromatic compound transport system permease small subunit